MIGVKKFFMFSVSKVNEDYRMRTPNDFIYFYTIITLYGRILWNTKEIKLNEITATRR